MTAHGPRATTLGRQYLLSHRDLLFPGRKLSRRGVLAATVRGPGTCGELQATLVAVAGVDRPVATGLAAGDLIPFAVGGGGRLAGEGDAPATEHYPGEGDFGDADTRCSGLTVACTHRLEDVLSRYALTRSAVGFGLERLPGQRRVPVPQEDDVGFTPRSRTRLQSDPGGPVGPPSPSIYGPPAYWMELSAIERGGTPFSRLGEPPQTLARSVVTVMSCETRRFANIHLEKRQEENGSVQVTSSDIEACPGRYLSVT